MSVCAREGCERPARGDEFCGQLCAKIGSGVIAFDPDARLKRRRRKYAQRTAIKKHGSTYIEVENTEAMDHRLPGSFGSGKRN